MVDGVYWAWLFAVEGVYWAWRGAVLLGLAAWHFVVDGVYWAWRFAVEGVFWALARRCTEPCDLCLVKPVAVTTVRFCVDITDHSGSPDSHWTAQSEE